MRTALYGVGLTALVTATLWAIWGAPALVPGISFGLLATGIQVVAVRLLRTGGDEFGRTMARLGMGMGLRLVGVVLFAVAVVVWRGVFPPLPTAFAYLGVVVPLLFLEIRLAR